MIGIILMERPFVAVLVIAIMYQHIPTGMIDFVQST